MHTIQKLTIDPSWIATMKMTMPQYSTDLSNRVCQTMIQQLAEAGVSQISPPYNFFVANDSSYRSEVIDVEVHVAVDKPALDSDILQFHFCEAAISVVRGRGASVEGTQNALRQWIQDHGYSEGGEWRQLIDDDEGVTLDCLLSSGK